jgi:hypothetical protein
MELKVKHIKLIQKLLNKWLAINLNIDGEFGTNTKNALNTVDELDNSWSYKRKAIGFIQLSSNKNGIDSGKLDGYWGPQTAYAFDVLKEFTETGIMPANWRDIEPLNINPNNWPKQNEPDLVNFYGEVGENQKRLQLPYPHRLSWDKRKIVNSFYCNAKVHDSLLRILSKVLETYGIDKIRELKLDLWGGCLSVRRMRGGTKWSTHSWGIAIDYNPDENQLKWGRDKAVFAKAEYDDWWKIWEEEGWFSLGRNKNYDWMHIQATKQ